MMVIRKAWTVLVAAVLVVGLVPGTCGAASHKAKTRAKAKAYVKPVSTRSSSGGSKVSVPDYMLKGSAVTKGRAFYRSLIPENALASIRLGRPANTILARWGNPSRITVGTAEADTATATGSTGPSYIPPTPTIYSGMGKGLDMATDMLGMQRSALPQLPGLGMPGMMGPTGMPGTIDSGQATTAVGGGQTRALSQEEVTWTYDLQDGITLEFIITDGTITQITVGGQGPWGLSKTRTGIQLGDSYKLVLWVNGFPEEPQKYVGRFLRVSYIDKNRTLFTFLNKKLVGITIALVQQELKEGAGQAGG